MRTCKGACGRQLMSWVQWRDTPTEVRVRDRAVRAKHDARGLCNSCRRAAEANGTLIDYERKTMTRTEVLAEWSLLYDPEVSIAENVRRIAPRIGMSEYALDRAITRARRDGVDTGRVAA